MEFRDKVVLVTGASSGIGYQAARAFAERGAIVVPVARREAQLQDLVEDLRGHSPNSFYITGDLADQSFAQELVRETVRRVGRIDVLINNAGISKHKQIYHLSAEEAEHVMRVNFLSAVSTSLAAIPPMLIQGGGFIVNVSSFAAKVTPPREAIYAASKAAMNSFTQGLWNDLAGSNIHAAIVNPGPIDTEIWGKLDEPPAYDGPKYPAQIVVDAIFEVIEKRRCEVTVPRWSPQLASARILGLLAPAVLRAGMSRMEPVPSEVIERARAKAREQAADEPRSTSRN
ncbi:MAG: SDR family NAD(P)-dependent oxidoreductase [Deltaproteobacteria bacterium]|nr:SDR family NAD(P)-dependent oxidoreductase [Deltaproteobacteria bacterium]MBW2389969.1 SDR family NAD(P)-dependent oxidoreductase [Deltaproteobacteria bacterium]MBW2723009.1 SDR family NAD(P)-dependent oxidoreductase [Deltaproteobacteria bacterium]